MRGKVCVTLDKAGREGYLFKRDEEREQKTLDVLRSQLVVRVHPHEYRTLSKCTYFLH